LKLLLDMNMPQRWLPALVARGHEARMWRELGDRRAPDTEIMAYAAQHEMSILTRDLDFGDLLAAAGALMPSVVIIRARGAELDALLEPVLRALEASAETMKRGALMSIGPTSARVRLLPLTRVDDH
jgi:predicted nuclease of predicted toxin-antitoxin system